MGRLIEQQGEFAGWTYWNNEPFEFSQVGPFYFNRDEKGLVGAFRAQGKHLNAGGYMHGGCLMTFADFALFALADDELDHDSIYVTLSLNSEFLYGAKAGDYIEARGEVLRSGKSILFVRGLITANKVAVLNFSGTIKKTGRKWTS